MVRLCRQHIGLVIVLVAFIALGTLYSVVDPIFESSDELWHYPYVKYIADGHGLLVMSPQPEKNVARQEGSQPPLYYLLGAAATFWIDTGRISDLYWLNPHATIGEPGADHNKNMVVHTDKENWPYHGVPLAVHIVRFLSVLLGTATVFLTYLLALEVFPAERTLAAGAAALNAFVPMFLFISGSVNNDNLVIPLCSLALVLLIRLVKGKPGIWSFLVLGAVLGLASLSKLSALGLFPLTAIVILFVAGRRRSLIALWKWGTAVILPAIAIAGWWYVRNWLLYGDPLGLNVHLLASGGRKYTPSLLDLWGESEGFKMSYWAVFGGFNVLADPFAYRLFDVILVLAGLGLVIYVLGLLKGRRWNEGTLLLLLVLWILILGVELMHWTQTTMASQGRLMFPAISAISLLFSRGLASLAPRRYTGLVLLLAGGSLLAVAAIIPFRNIAPAYAKPPILREADLPAIIHPLNMNYAGQMELIGYELPETTVLPGGTLELTLYWRSLDRMNRDYSIFIHLFGKDNQWLGQRDTFPGGGTYPTRLWRVGDIVRDTYRLHISQTAIAPALGQIQVGLYLFPSMEVLPAYDLHGRSIGSSPTIARLKVKSPIPQAMPIAHPLQVDFGDKVALIGYDLPLKEVRAGELLRGVLYWRALNKMERDYTIFVHLVGKDGMVGQYDAQPQGGDYPTSFWDKGEVVPHPFQIALRPGLAPGEYTLVVGIYDLATMQRLRTAKGDSAELTHILVVLP
ncbi:MAG: glycosyltransferase family 39 protein [Chloroflexi bacterium]|nr:glycosyltransferase family 39 protein [Chloroflexota bacterium]